MPVQMPNAGDIRNQLLRQMGASPMQIGAYYNPVFDQQISALYDQLTRQSSDLDLQQQRLGSDYETAYGRLGQKQGVDQRNLMDTLASRGFVFSGNAVDQQAQQADIYNQQFGDLAQKKQRGLEDIARTRLNLEGGYQGQLGNVEANYTNDIQNWLAQQNQEAARRQTEAAQQAAQTGVTQKQQELLQKQMELMRGNAAKGIYGGLG